MKTELRKLGGHAVTRVVTGLLVLVVLPVTMVTLVARERALSPFDEAAHVDYLRRIERFEIPRWGDLRERDLVFQERCRETPAGKPLTCPPSDATRLEMFATAATGGGYSYEAQQPPLYYAVTAVLRLATDPFTSDYILSARLTGIFWLCGGLLMLYWAIRRLGAGHYASLFGGAIVAGSPAVIWQTGTVNNDAAAIVVAAAALLLLGWLRTAERLWPWLVAGSVAAACMWLKPTFLVAFFVVGAVLVWWRFRSDRWGGSALRLALLLGPPAIAYLAWSVIASSRSIVDHDVVVNALLAPDLRTNSFPWREVLPSVARMLRFYDISPLEMYTVPIDSAAVQGLAAVVGLLVLAGAVTWLFQTRPATVGDQLGIVAVGAVALLGPAWVVLLYRQFSQATGGHQRYAIVLLPLLAASVALGSGRRGQLVTSALIAATVAAAAYRLV